MSVGQPIDPEKFSSQNVQPDSVIKVPASELSATPYLGTLTIGGLVLDFPECFLPGNAKFPKKVMEVRFGLEDDSPADSIVTGEDRILFTRDELVGCAIWAVVGLLGIWIVSLFV